MALIWGIDLGGTKVEGVIVDSENFHEPLFKVRIPTEPENGYEHVVNQIGRLCEELRTQSGHPYPKNLGIGTPGSLDQKTGLLRGSNTQCLNGRPLQADVAVRLGFQVTITNDANCFALAESVWGAAKGYGVVFGVILGTGVGGGIVVDGKVLNGKHGIAGEWGQIILEPGGPVSNYGTRGTIESLIAGPGLEKFYFAASGQQRRLKEIASRAESDPHAKATLNHLVENLAKGLAIIVNVLDPDVIVIGGGVGNLDVLYTETFRWHLQELSFTDELKTSILRPSLGDSAGVFGAAAFGAATTD